MGQGPAQNSSGYDGCNAEEPEERFQLGPKIKYQVGQKRESCERRLRDRKTRIKDKRAGGKTG